MLPLALALSLAQVAPDTWLIMRQTRVARGDAGRAPRLAQLPRRCDCAPRGGSLRCPRRLRTSD